MSLLFAWASLLVGLGPGVAEPPARFVVVVGNNHSIEAETPDLVYADDDAVLFVEHLRPYSHQIELLTVLDTETQRLHPGIASLAQVPTRATFDATLARVYRAIGAVRGASELYFVFIGHGSVDDRGEGFMHLQDGPLTRDDLFAKVVAGSPASATHVIIDACNAFTLVGGRGEGGQTRHVDTALFDAFLQGHQLEAYPKVGVLVAASDSHESHEWSQLRAGVFSHQVRSALTGASDVNQDGVVEYSEVGAFVEAAGAGLRRYGKRLSVFAWPPSGNRRQPLLDLRRSTGMRRLTMTGAGGHLYLETEGGVRWTDVHATGPVSMQVPREVGFFVRDGRRETFVAPAADDVMVSMQLGQPVSVQARGAVDRAFSKGLFAVPYSADYYRGWVAARPEFIEVELVDTREAEDLRRWRFGAGYALGQSPLVEERLEHAAAFSGARDLSVHLALAVGLEAGYADVRREFGLGRTALFGGLTGQGGGERFQFEAGFDVGWAVLFVRADRSSADYSVPGLRGRAAFSARLTPQLWVQLGAAYTAYRASAIGEGEKVRGSLQGTLGMVWR